MFTFGLFLWKLLQALGHGLRKDPEFRFLLILLAVILACGTGFYWRWEGWSIIDSLYFCVICMASIGFGDLTPTQPMTKLFTILYAFIGVGVFVAVAGKIVMIILHLRLTKTIAAKPTKSKTRKPSRA
jgi:voltage-gated potassium channel